MIDLPVSNGGCARGTWTIFPGVRSLSLWNDPSESPVCADYCGKIISFKCGAVVIRSDFLRSYFSSSFSLLYFFLATVNAIERRATFSVRLLNF